MLMRINETIRRHLSDNIIAYAIIIFFFILGISMGAFAVSNLDIDTKSDVKAYIDGFVSISRAESVHSSEIFKQSIKSNFITSVILFFAGLTYLGIVIVPLISVFRGFCIGFTVAFLSDSLGRGGFMLSLASILPQNLVYMPLLIIFCVCSITFSTAILKSKLNKKYNEFSGYTLSYGMTAFLLFALTIGGSIIESYITPYLVKLVAPYLM